MTKSLHLVEAKTLAAAQAAPDPSNTRLAVGDYIADVLLDARRNVKVYHWIVQKAGSAAIVQWGQEYSFEAAQAAVKTYLENLTRNVKVVP